MSSLKRWSITAGTHELKLSLKKLMFYKDNFSNLNSWDSSFSSSSEDSNTPEGIFDLGGIDADGDGIIDTMVTGTDSDMDGDIDIIQTFTDTDGDQVADSYSEAHLIDSDGNGEIDSIDFYTDENMDNIMDVHGTLDDKGNISIDTDMDDVMDIHGTIDSNGNVNILDPSIDIIDDVDDSSLQDTSTQWFGPDVQNFDPSNYDSDDIIGDPSGCMEHFHVQDGQSSCAVVSQEFVLEQLTGREFDEHDLCDLAAEKGWFDPDPDGGTLPCNVGNILSEYGLNVTEPRCGGTIEDIESCLSSGGQVVIGVDSSELYFGNDDGPFNIGMQSDHAVQVIGIDKSDPSNPMVILNDSGISDGAGAMVPLDDFMDAWEDSGCFMVEAYA